MAHFERETSEKRTDFDEMSRKARGAAGAGTLLSAQFAVQNLRFKVGKIMVLDEKLVV